MRWVKKNQNLIAVPRILKGPKKIIPFYMRSFGENPYLYVVKMERLFPLTDSFLKKNIGKMVEDGTTYLACIKKNVDITEEWISKIQNEWKKYPGLQFVCEAYLKLLNDDVQGSPDLHSENFMQRADGTLIMTDPLWAGETPYQAYDRAMKAELDIGDDEYEPDNEYNTIRGGEIRPKKRPKTPKQNTNLSDFLDDMPF